MLFNSFLPVTTILFSGVALLSASLGSVQLSSLQQDLSNRLSENDSLINQSLPALAMILIVTGIAFRMGAVRIRFHDRELLKAMPFWLTTLYALISVSVGSVLLVLFVDQIAVIDFGLMEQILFFVALIVLASTAGLLLIEKELKVLLILMIMQITGVFFAQLSVTCWKWRHDLSGGESVSILDRMYEFSPMIVFSFLAVMGIACLLDSLSTQQSKIIYQDQLQGLICDQRLLGSAAVILLATLMGFPGFSGFQLKWQTVLSLFESHQELSTGVMPSIHTAYLGLACLILFSSAIVAFICAKLIIQITFARPLNRYRLITQKKMAFICYSCVIISLIFNLRLFANLL